MMLKGVRTMRPFLGACPHYPPHADTSINRTLFNSTSHVTGGISQSITTKVNHVWTTCKPALGLLDADSPKGGLCIQARRHYYAKLSRHSTKEFGAGNLLFWACYKLPLLGGQLNYGCGASPP
jgi:hypothetical protein